MIVNISGIRRIFALIVMGSLFWSCQQSKEGYDIQLVDFEQVHITDTFWADRLATNHETTIDHVLDMDEKTGRILNFERAADGEGTFASRFPYDDTDVYKAIEGAAYVLKKNDDKELEQRVDSLITKIAAAQAEDGYLYNFGRLDLNEEAGGAEQKKWRWGTGRWQKVYLHSHELYNAGHLMEAAVAYYEATGKRSLLDVAINFADLIADTFGPAPNQQKTIPGHQEVELGLVKLYRVTGNETYLETADFFLEERGKEKYADPGERYPPKYRQNFKRVKEQSEAAGHAVRAGYMYAAMADIGALTGDQKYIDAIDRIWEDVVSSKLYIIGGIGSSGHGEGFGEPYDLPNATSYNETCAAIANVFWNHRMFLLHKNAKYIDVLERSLYNNVLSGVSLEGNEFFYPNRLKTEGGESRQAWYEVACCPGNIARAIPAVPQYIYAVGEQTAYVNLFVDNTADLTIDGEFVQLEQQTDYPWDGKVTISVQPESEQQFILKVRIPGWARNQPVPSTLYRYLEETEAPKLHINGEEQPLNLDKGYAVINRSWQNGDTVELSLPMEVRKTVAHDSLTINRGNFALERGPIVYAAESVDNGKNVLDLSIDPSSEFTTEFQPDLLNGVVTIHGRASNGNREQDFTAIPYYSWANRGDSKMSVWLNRE